MTEREPPSSPAPRRPFVAVAERALQAMVVVPILAAGAVSLALVAYGGVETWRFVEGLARSGAGTPYEETMLRAIKIIDLFLLATVAQVVAVGLYQLYFDPGLRLPRWLRIAHLDDLKSKLVSVIVTVLAADFLGQALAWDGSVGIAWLGAGVAAVIAALTAFLWQIGARDD